MIYGQFLKSADMYWVLFTMYKALNYPHISATQQVFKTELPEELILELLEQADLFMHYNMDSILKTTSFTKK